MRKKISLVISLGVLVMIPIMLFNILGFHYEENQMSTEGIIAKTEELMSFDSPSFGTEKHKIYQQHLINELENMGYDIEIQEFSQLGPVSGEKRELSIEGLDVINLYAPAGGKSIGANFIADMIVLNLGEVYNPADVKGRLIYSASYLDLSGDLIEELYDNGCKGIIVGEGNYRDGNTQFNYAKYDGKLMPIFYIDEASKTQLLDLAKESLIDRKETSKIISFSGVEYFTAGIIVDVSINYDKTIEIIEGKNIIASIDRNKEDTLMIGTHYDGDGSGSGNMKYFNTTSIATLLEMAKTLKLNEKHLQKNIEIVLFDAGLLEQAGVDYYYESQYKTTESIYLDHLGFGKYIVNSNGENSQFLANKLLQYDYDRVIKKGSLRNTRNIGFVAPGRNVLMSHEEGILFTADPRVNPIPYILGENPLEAINFQPMIQLFDRYFKVEVFGDHYPSYMTSFEWLILFILFVMLVVLVVFYQLRKIVMIRSIYYSVYYSIFKVLSNSIFIVIATLITILIIAIMPETYNISLSSGSNLRFYSLWYQIIHIIRDLITNGFGTSTAGIPYLEIIVQNSLSSFKLLSIALGLAVLLGLSIGMFGSYHNKSHKTHQSIWIIFGLSVPETVLIVLLLFSLAPIMRVQWIASSIEVSDLRTIVMPIFAMALIPTIYIARTVYMTLVEETKSKYIRSLKAKGVQKNRIYTHHLSKIAFSKIMDSMTIILAIGISTMIISERQFAVPGIVLNIFRALNESSYSYYLGLVMCIMIYYYVVILSSKLISKLLMPRSGGAYEIE